MTARTETRLELLERACKADPGIRALDRAVTALCAAASATEGPACSACTWERIVKPLVLPLIGWGRGLPSLPARDPRVPGGPLQPVDLGELMAQMDEQQTRRTPATTDTERWLRTQEAWDAVTASWLARLYDADPALGHGISYLSAGDS